MSTSTRKGTEYMGYCGPLTVLSSTETTWHVPTARQHVMSDENQRSPDHHENRESLKKTI